MKYIILTLIALVISIGVLVSLADSRESSNEVQKSSIGIGVNGQVGVKISDNLCVNPSTGAAEVCF